MLKSLNHIGIAVNSIDEVLKIYQEIFKLSEPKILELKEMNLKIALFYLTGIKLEFIEPLSSETTIAKFLDKRGPGIHHLCFNVENIEKVLEELKSQGIILIDEKPRIGALGNKIAFISPKSTNGVLIELSEEINNKDKE
ncbi:MAG: methylmalonyl-CoA epimerase [candidate division WOR-3 bacterium]|nr:methylmalonyl-CoA epimerase [candidate division WOR-3 bacterium]MDW7988441.1 methylmalonyl-CoA epimerase [candidate division WOR-3 bacterium]